ncbi:MAG: Na+/H+ antiporter subunit B [Acidobacteriota bacterium]
MTSLILVTATQLLQPLLLLVSIFVLLRGHNEPGGGFAGGLLAASAFALQGITSSFASARRVLRVEPQILIGAGLLVAACSGLISLVLNRPFMTGYWVVTGVVPLGTVLLFDIGVYLVVFGTVLIILFTLAEDSQ